MKACRAPSRTSASRYALLLGILGVNFVLAQSSATMNCIPHGYNGDDDDDIDEDGEDGGLMSSWTRSWCAGPTGTWSGSWSGIGPTASGAALGAGNTNLSTNSGGISKGGIAGIAIGVAALFSIIAFFLLRRLRRQYARKRRLDRKGTLIGPAIATSTHPAGTKEGAQMFQSMANVAPSHPPGLHRSLSRDTLPQIPFDTPAYTSTDNLASLSYAQSHAQRTSTVLSYSSPSESTGVTAATAGHGHSSGYGHMSLHEDMLARQKQLETGYRQMEMGETSAPTSGSNHSIIPMNLPQHPPPRYNE